MLKWVLKIKNDLELKGLVWFCTFAGFVWFRINLVISQELPRKCSGKESTCQRRRHKRHRFDTWEDPLREEMATHSNILAWEIPWTEESVTLQSMGSQRVRHTWAHTHSTTKQLTKKLWTSRDFTFQRPRREKAALNSCPWKPYPGPHCQGWPSMFW